MVINQGGCYTIEGEVPGITLTSGNFETISIDNVESCDLKDFSIDASAILAATTTVIDANDQYITIDNVRITGDGSGGRGIYVSDPVQIIVNIVPKKFEVKKEKKDQPVK